jgi:hypothetical protein
MRRVFPPLAIALAAVGLAALWAGWSHSHDSHSAPIAAANNRKATCPRYLGVATCAAMACHNGNGPRGTKGSEYSTWIAVDPHSRAYQALYKPESRAMHDIMAKAFPSMRSARGAHENPLCLQCHGMGAHVKQQFQVDGVGCERCHGPAEKWLTTHYLPGFDRRTPGFNDTRSDLVGRAQTCTKCHVGNADQQVDHVLIAAGHPRLRFEYAAYYGIYPRHWEDLGENRLDPSFETRNWVVGQLVAARAALDLTASRAHDPQRRTNWPEFAEYDCTACHHALDKPSQRQERAERLAGKRRAGELPWGTWYFPILPVLAKHGTGAPAGLDASLRELDRLMRLPYPPPARVTAQARHAAGLVDKWIGSAVKLKGSKAQIDGLMRDLAGQRDTVDGSWDGGTQVYLGLAALHQTLGDIDPSFAARSPYLRPLAEVKYGLKKSFPAGGRPLYDMPSGYPKQLGQIFRGLNAIRGTE